MFANVQNRQPLQPATPELLHALHRLSEPESADEQHHAVAMVAEPVMSLDSFDAAVELEVVAEAQSSASDSIQDISEDEFEKLLDELHGTGAPGRVDSTPAKTVAPTVKAPLLTSGGSDDITDDEFEAILDQLHGKGSFVPGEAAAPVAAVNVVAPAAKSAKAPGAADDISDDDRDAAWHCE